MNELISGAPMTGTQRVPPYAEIYQGDLGGGGQMAHSGHPAKTDP